MSEEILITDFLEVDMRIGKIMTVNDFPKAKKPSYQLAIDFGKEIGIKKSSAQITKLYSKEELMGMLVIAVVNFPPRQIADFISEVLVLGIERGDGEVVLLIPERDAEVGMRIT